jgi:hypothetical protein
MSKVEDHYNLTKLVFEKNRVKILADLETSVYKKSAKAIYRQQEKIEKLVTGLVAISKTDDNFYSVQAMTRIIIEHFLVGHYIWTRTRLTKTDTVGEEYYAYYDISEFFKRENFELRVEGIRHNKKNNNTFQNILLKLPQFTGVDENQLAGIHKTAKQFDLRYILDYFINEIPNDIFSDFHSIMLDALSQYNHLSSYIHGGPSAELETFEGRHKTNKSLRIVDCVNTGKIYARTMKEHLLFLLADDNKDYIEILREIFKDYKD